MSNLEVSPGGERVSGGREEGRQISPETFPQKTEPKTPVHGLAVMSFAAQLFFRQNSFRSGWAEQADQKKAQTSSDN